jgi:hypothetical protein
MFLRWFTPPYNPAYASHTFPQAERDLRRHFFPSLFTGRGQGEG